MKVKDIVNEDWGSSDWYAVIQSMDRTLEHLGKVNPETIQQAAEDAAYSYMEHMGYSDHEQAANACASMWLRRKGFADLLAPKR